MNVLREQLLSALQSAAYGLAKKEIIEQSKHFVFTKKKVITYNDEVFCAVDSPVDVEGAVPSDILIGLLKKLSVQEVDVSVEKGCFCVKAGKKRKAEIKMDSEIKLPIDAMEFPTKWKKLPEDFEQAVRVVLPCAGFDSSKFLLTCVNIAPEWIEASDNYQVCRYTINTGVKAPTVIRRSSLQSIIGMKVKEFGETDNWFHFRGTDMPDIACRRYTDKYASDVVARVLARETIKRIQIPKDLSKSLDKCRLFGSGDIGGCRVDVRFEEGTMFVRGKGPLGKYEEKLDSEYKDAPIGFSIDPDLLSEISRRKGKCFLAQGMLKVEAQKFTYITATIKGE